MRSTARNQDSDRLTVAARRCRRLGSSGYDTCASAARARYLSRTVRADRYDVVYKTYHGGIVCKRLGAGEAACVTKLHYNLPTFRIRLELAAKLTADQVISHYRPTDLNAPTDAGTTPAPAANPIRIGSAAAALTAVLASVVALLVLVL